MDKSWMLIKNVLDPIYQKGVKKFLTFAFKGKASNCKLPCPCKNCNNFDYHTENVIDMHLSVNGIVQSYDKWVYHGEGFEDESDDDMSVTEEDTECDDIPQLLDDIGVANFGHDWRNEEENYAEIREGKEREASRFLRLLSEAQQDLYPGCKNYSKLAFIVNIFHLKTMNKWTCKSIDGLLKFLKHAFPMAEIPNSFYEAKNFIRDLGLKCEKIHACENDCILYWKENEGLDHCPNMNCKAPRYKYSTSKVPRKVVRYFPLKPRLQRLFINKEIARDMRWHAEKRVMDDNILRHPADSEAWKEFDQNHESFAVDPRNVRLGLASDGFNPFGNMSTAYSIWPVILVPYNLPPWKCLKDPFFMLSLIIPGPKSPGSEIDVFLRPLIDELKELWEIGIDTYDSYSGKNFQLRAALLWTINDFPAYAYLSGWSTKGYKACPICMGETTSAYLRNSCKCCYMGHRRFLPLDHKWRREKVKFNGEKDLRDPVRPLTGEDILQQLQSIDQVQFGKNHNVGSQRKRKRQENNLNWMKRSIFFELPYWSTNKLRHNLDIMHIVKNVCESLIGTLMNIDGKTKDSWKARKDLMDMGIKPELHIQKFGDSFVTPAACYTFTRQEKQNFCQFFMSIKYPDGFASNISRCVKSKDSQISGMKSHDYYVLLQRILPLAIRGMLTREVCQVLVELSNFFRKLCSRTLHVHELEKMEKDIALILCKLERIFPPSFFDIMIHLMVHLPTEAKIAGPAQYRWMFPFERKMGQYKGYVHNKARPEGCIAERYIDDECLTFISMYLRNAETRFNRPERNADRGESTGELSVFAGVGRPLGSPTFHYLDDSELAKVHMFILKNCEEIDSYIEEHKVTLAQESGTNIDRRHDVEFPRWFEDRVTTLHGSGQCSDELLSLAKGPDNRVRRYNSCNVNGFRFHTVAREKERKSQNSGIMVKGWHNNEAIIFYGVLKDIMEVDYLFGSEQVLLFKCDWWNVGTSSGIVVDKEWNLTSINFSRTWYVDQPFILASQAEQVFYLKDLKLGGHWHIVEKVVARSSYDVPERESDASDKDDPYQELYVEHTTSVVENDEVPTLNRGDVVSDEVVVENVMFNEVFQQRAINEDQILSNDDADDIEHQSSNDDEQEGEMLSIDDDLDSE